MRRARGREESLVPDMDVSYDGPSFALQERWIYSSAQAFVEASVAVTGHSALSDGENNLCGLSPSGELIFSKRFDEAIRSFRLSRDGSNIFVSLADRTIALLDLSGTTVWTTRYPHVINASDMRLSDGAILVGGDSRCISILDRGGELVRTMQIPLSIESIDLSAEEDLALLGNSNAAIALLDGEFDQLWVRKLNTMSGLPHFSPCCRWITLPAFGMGAFLFDREGLDARAFKSKQPISFAVCVPECAMIALGTINGGLSFVNQAGDAVASFDLPFRPKSWAIDANSQYLIVADRLGVVYGYEITSGDSSRFTFLEHSSGKGSHSEKKPLFSAKLFSRPSSRQTAQIRVLPGGKHSICATTDGRIISFDEKGRSNEIANLGGTVFSLCLASRSYSFAATTEGYLNAFAHDQLLWRRRVGTAMLAVNAIGNRFATMDMGGNICVFDADGQIMRTWMDSADARYFLISPSGEDMVVAEGNRAVLVDFKGRGVFSVEFTSGGSRLALDDESLFVGDTRGVVSAFDLLGERIWAADLGSPITRLRPFEDGLFCRTTRDEAILIGQDGRITWRKELADRHSTVARNQNREFIEVFREGRSLICASLGGTLLWRADLRGGHRSLSIDASGEFIGAFDGAYAWLFAVSDFEPSEPGRFDFLEI
ncbi:MAG: PQQ-binding-like beta-propeller repeat protein [Candidatus Coatesbacteria bacterium]|nr:PQQ-binding-like beta-propeller repeat protein [Candidatus Coatesbacteria bacterium]